MNITNYKNNQIKNLKARHNEIDEKIQFLIEDSNCDQLEIRRLKKEKLQLKDKISKIEARLLPNIIA